MNTAKTYLAQFGIRPSVQRVAVMNYLLTHRTHPTADEIYSALAPDMPTLSRTTVYNTLHLLYERGAILALCIDGINAHFDGYTHPHAHFLCACCGKVYDVDLDDPTFVNRNAPQSASQITDAQIYYKGVCGNCGKQN